MLAGLTLLAVFIQPYARAFIPLAGIGRAVLAVSLGVIMVYAADYAVAGRLAWTPGGFALSFGRMLQDGVVARYLDDHCPDTRLRLCAHRNELPRDADAFFWGDPLFEKLGRFKGLGDEMSKIAMESVVDYPLMQLEMATIASAEQLVDVQSGEGVFNTIWHTYGIMKRYTPSVLPAMRAARQQHGEISFDAINPIHYPVALGSMALLPAMLLLAWRRRRLGHIDMLAATVTLALVINAVVCGVFSNPHDRYGARIAWVAPLVVALAVVRRHASRSKDPSTRSQIMRPRPSAKYRLTAWHTIKPRSLCCVGTSEQDEGRSEPTHRRLDARNRRRPSFLSNYTAT